MKKLIPIAFCGILLTGMFGCNNESTEYKTEVQGLRTYVDSVSALDWTDNSRTWDDVDITYRERLDRIETRSADFDDLTKEEYAKIKADYDNLKARYNNQRAQALGSNLRSSLYGDGNVGEDMNFAFMTSENAAATYDRFIKTIDANKSNYSANDWQEINALYAAMEARKGELKDMKSEDEKKISDFREDYEDFKDFFKDMKDDFKDGAKDTKDATKDAKDAAKDAKDDMKDRNDD